MDGFRLLVPAAEAYDHGMASHEKKEENKEIMMVPENWTSK